MQIDLRTVSITPKRQTFDHIAKRIGGDKPASRYLEGTMDVQATANFHYRPTWDPDYEIFDPKRTAIVMADWYKLADPRQFYYGTYTIARARMQDTAEADFDMVEERGFADTYPADAKKTVLDFFIPLRHVAWGSNVNNSYISSYAYGTSITQPALYHSMDQLGIAQYLTRLALTMDDVDALDTAKEAWMNGAQWQGLRRYVENTMVMKDWFELFVAQNFALDGLLYPLAYKYVDNALSAQAGPVLSMLTRFQNEWFAETSKWVDANLKAAANESAENKAQLSAWTKAWRDRAVEALKPLAQQALGAQADSVLTEIVEQFNARAAKIGLAL